MPKLTKRQLDRIAAAVRTVEGDTTSLGGRAKGSTPGRTIILAKVTDADADTGAHAWEQVDHEGATVTDGLTGTLDEREAYRVGGGTVPTGTKIILHRIGIEEDGTYRPAFAFVSDGVLKVSLAQTGGSAGSNSPPTACTYTYTATIGGVEIGTGLSPLRGRYIAAQHSAASVGLGLYVDGTFELWDCNETVGTSAC